MISVQNHLQLLNGNKLLAVLSILLLSCSASKPAINPSKTQIVKTSGKEPVTKRDTTDVPEVKKDTKVAGDDKTKVDTIRWKDASDKYPAIVLSDRKAGSTRSGNFKDMYNVKLLIPLNSDEIGDPGTSRFTYFYAGVLLALDELNQEGVRLNIEVIDTEESGYNIDSLIDKIAGKDTDLIIGPFDRDDIKKLTDICKEREIVLVSPWYTSSKLTTKNPYYLQMSPNLKEHYLKLVRHAVQSYKPKEVTILIRGSKDMPWVDYFEGEAKKLNNGKEFFNTYTVNTDSLRLGPTAFFNMFKTQNIKAVVLPNYSYNDEHYIYSCLRRLSAEIGTRSLSVLGMPIVYDSDKVEFDYYRTLQMKVVMADYVDENYGKIREFRRKFLDTYGEIPTVEAVRGHDLILFLGRNLKQYGRMFQENATYDSLGYLQSIYDIRKSVSDDSSGSSDPDYFDYYENKHLDIIEFRGNKWIKH